jgi:DNA-binding GntR family transcriptional regulator
MSVVAIETVGNRRSGREVERIFVALMDEILSGDLSAGAKINEPEVARRHGVSRGPVREAIRRLQERGLVQCTPNSGARVVVHTPKDILDSYEMREALEGAAARLSAQNMTEEDRAELRSFVEREAAGHLVPVGQPNFHQRIVNGSHNNSICAVLNSDFYDVLKLWRKNFQLFRNVDERSRLDHRRVLEAIEYRDAESAEFLMRRHVRRLRDLIKEDLRKFCEP